jgi:hypothetical protein
MAGFFVVLRSVKGIRTRKDTSPLDRYASLSN